MPQNQIPVACVQTQAHDRERFDAAWPSILEAAGRACREGAKLVVLPEGTVPGYVLGDEPVDAAILASAALDVSRVAREHGATIVYGGAKIDGGRTFNAAICVGPDGTELGFAAKQFLWHFDRRWFAPGATLDPIDTPLGKLGLLVCADGRIPTIASTLVERGAQILVMPTAWVTSGRDPASLENIQADLMANVRARENGVPFVVANKCGVERESVAYCGKSAIVDATGAFAARAGEREPAIVAATVSPSPVMRRVPDEQREPRGVVGSTPHVVPARARARIAFAFADSQRAHRYASLAVQADADTLVTFGSAVANESEGGLPQIALDASGEFDRAHEVAGLRYALVSAAALRSPRALVRMRLDGVDFFIASVDGDPDWNVRVARTRAAELRAFVLVFDDGTKRAFAVDPDGAVVAGTYDDFRLATFVYDAARANATLVAPRTDVLEGLRFAENLRGARATVTA